MILHKIDHHFIQINKCIKIFKEQQNGKYAYLRFQYRN